MTYSWDATSCGPPGLKSKCASHLYTAPLSSLVAFIWITDVKLPGFLLVLAEVWFRICLPFLNHIRTRCSTGATLLMLHVRLCSSIKVMTPFEPAVEMISMLSGNAAEGKTGVMGLCCSHSLLFYTNKRKTYCIVQLVGLLGTLL